VALGYSWRDGILAASDVGAPHKRDRWWCLARRTNAHGLRELQPEGGECDERGWVGDVGGEVADATGQRLEVPQPSQAGDEQPTATGADWSYGWWAAEPGMGRMAHGVAHRSHRIKCLGNGQVPLAAAVAWRLLGGP
jgi:DNA (cytosine-5)-methyltransferase 1